MLPIKLKMRFLLVIVYLYLMWAQLVAIFPKGNAHYVISIHSKNFVFARMKHGCLCHDYPPIERKEYHYLSTVKEQKETNIHIRQRN